MGAAFLRCLVKRGEVPAISHVHLAVVFNEEEGHIYVLWQEGGKEGGNKEGNERVGERRGERIEESKEQSNTVHIPFPTYPI